MGNKTSAFRNQFDAFIFQKIGLDGRNSDSFNTFNFIQFRNQIEKSMFVFFISEFTFTIIADIYAG